MWFLQFNLCLPCARQKATVLPTKLSLGPQISSHLLEVYVFEIFCCFDWIISKGLAESTFAVGFPGAVLWDLPLSPI